MESWPSSSLRILPGCKTWRHPPEHECDGEMEAQTGRIAGHMRAITDHSPTLRVAQQRYRTSITRKTATPPISSLMNGKAMAANSDTTTQSRRYADFAIHNLDKPGFDPALFVPLPCWGDEALHISSAALWVDWISCEKGGVWKLKTGLMSCNICLYPPVPIAFYAESGACMKAQGIMLTVALCLVAELCFAADANLGTWKLHTARSEFNRGSPKNDTVV